MTEAEAKVGKDIEDYGWHVVKVFTKDSGPDFAYSIGLFQSFGHPEILIVGLGLDTMHQIINNIGAEVKRGKTFQDGQSSDDILEGYECIFREVLPEYFHDLFGWAIWHYEGKKFLALQCIWPDRDRRFPWEEESGPEFPAHQPTYFLPRQ
jgi:hypothetical protein